MATDSETRDDDGTDRDAVPESGADGSVGSPADPTSTLSRRDVMQRLSGYSTAVLGLVGSNAALKSLTGCSSSDGIPEGEYDPCETDSDCFGVMECDDGECRVPEDYEAPSSEGDDEGPSSSYSDTSEYTPYSNYTPYSDYTPYSNYTPYSDSYRNYVDGFFSNFGI
jgi:hypothetical protein